MAVNDKITNLFTPKKMFIEYLLCPCRYLLEGAERTE